MDTPHVAGGVALGAGHPRTLGLFVPPLIFVADLALTVVGRTGRRTRTVDLERVGLFGVVLIGRPGTLVLFGPGTVVVGFGKWAETATFDAVALFGVIPLVILSEGDHRSVLPIYGEL
jgi:hypothetical protein